MPPGRTRPNYIRQVDGNSKGEPINPGARFYNEFYMVTKGEVLNPPLRYNDLSLK